MSSAPTQPDAIDATKEQRVTRPTQARARKNSVFIGIAITGTTIAIAILFILLATVVLQGAHKLSWTFVSNMSSKPEEAGIFAALIGTIIVCFICALSAIPLGVGTAILIEEFKPKGPGVNLKHMLMIAAAIGLVVLVAVLIGRQIHIMRAPLLFRMVYALFFAGIAYAVFHPMVVFLGKARPIVVLHSIVETNIRNLAGVPSIVYGILGVTAFAMMFNLFGTAGASHFTIGQKWYDQYVDAQGHLLFVPVEDFDSPATPLYDAPVDEPKRFEVWHDRRTPLILGTETDITNPEDEISDERAVRLDVEATLELRDSHWVLVATEEAAEEVNFTRMGVQEGDKVRFGFLYDEYTARMMYSEFTVTSVANSSLGLYGGPIESFQDAVGPDGKQIERRVMPRESFGPMLSTIESALDEFEDVIKDGINDTREGRRNNGPAQIDRKKAEEITDAAIAAGPFTGDTSELRETLVTQILACDGMESSDLRRARRALIRSAAEAERDSRLRGQALGGQNPNRVDYRTWYYISLPFGRGVLAGGLTLMLVILPIVIVASQEALRGVPASYRQGALAMGATKWQSVSKTALPAAVPGICTGTILALSRAIGEAAPILILGGVVFINFTPGNLMDSFTVMPLQIFSWAGQPQDVYRELAAAGIIVLLGVLLCFNGVAIYIRQRSSRHR